MAKERSCIFCGQKYEYCPHCSDSSKYPTWKFNFDTEKCHDLYEVVAGYNMGVNTINDVKKTLDKYGVTSYSMFSKKLQDKLNELVPAKKKEESESKKVEEPEIKKSDDSKEKDSFSRKLKKNNKY